MVTDSQANIFLSMGNPNLVDASRPPPPAPAEAPSVAAASRAAAAPPPVDTFTPEEQASMASQRSMERQAMLLELQRMEAGGAKLSRPFSVEDSTQAMALEIDRHRSQQDTDASVQLGMDMLRLLFSGTEMANNRFGPFLRLDGFADQMCSPTTMERMKPAVTRIYKRVFRRGAPSPFLELGFIIISTLIFTHMSNSSSSSRPPSVAQPPRPVKRARMAPPPPATPAVVPAPPPRPVPSVMPSTLTPVNDNNDDNDDTVSCTTESDTDPIVVPARAASSKSARSLTVRI